MRTLASGLILLFIPLTCMGQISSAVYQAAWELQAEERAVGELSTLTPQPLNAPQAIVSLTMERRNDVPASPLPATGRYVDPNRAQLLSTLLPGAGQIYAGNYEQGAAVLIGTPGALAIGTLLSEPWTCHPSCAPAEIAPFFIGAAVSAGLWYFTISQAPHDARRTNTERRAVAGIGTMSAGDRVQPSVVVTLNW